MTRCARGLAALGAVVLALAGYGAFGSAAHLRAAPVGPTQPRAIIVLIDSASLIDVSAPDLPGFAELRRRGSIGLTTLPLHAGANNAAAYATIGAGSPVPEPAAPPRFANGYEASETVNGIAAAAAYARATGVRSSAGILDPDIGAFTHAFRAGGGDALAGLGDSLRAAGLSAALVGNADGGSAAQLDRSAMLVAMDASGAVATGAIGREMLVADPSRPLGVHTDFPRLLAETRTALHTGSLVVVETGDLQRVRDDASLAPEAAAAAHARALAATDAFLRRLVPLADDRTLLVVVSTSVPASEAAAGRSLAPVWVAGGGFAAAGRLSTATTRDPGLVTLHDIAPTVLAHLRLRPGSPMLGLPIASVGSSDSVSLLDATLRRAGTLHSQRARAIDAIVFAQALLLLALCVPWVHRRVLGGRWWWALPYFSGAAALAIVLQPAFGSPSLALALAATAAIGLAIAVALAAMRDRVVALGVLASATVGVLVFDLVAGGPLSRWSFLGYDTVVGGRFYGIGNELEGVLVGAGVVAAACLVALSRRHRRLAVGVVGAGCLALIGVFALPGLGADAGGALAAAVGVGFTFYGLAGGRFTWPRVLLLAAVFVAIGIAGLVIATALGGSASSHVGRYLERLSHGDLSFATEIVRDKVRANVYLLATSSWRAVLLSTTLVLGVLGTRYRARLRASFSATPDLAHGLAGLIAGGAAVFVLNDSGVIALSTLAPFAVVLVMTLIAVNPAEKTAP